MEKLKDPYGGREKSEGEREETWESMKLIHAACMLMAADPHLSPDDAVNDVYQIYDRIRHR